MNWQRQKNLEQIEVEEFNFMCLDSPNLKKTNIEVQVHCAGIIVGHRRWISINVFRDRI